VYAAVLESERAAYDDPHGWDPRWMCRHHGNGFYCSTPGVVCDHEPCPVELRRGGRQQLELIGRLEAQETVVVFREHLDGETAGKLAWPAWVAHVEISPDDTVRPYARRGGR
jgi:hypothetical protein